jgi:hypothetical protein
VGVSALSLALSVPTRADSFFFNFDNQSDAGLTRYNPLAAFGQGGSYSFPQLSAGNFGYQLTQAGLPSNNPAGRARMGSSVTGLNFGAFAQAVDVVNFDPTLGQVFGMGTRVNNIGLGTTSGYALVYVTPTGHGTNTGEFGFDIVTNEAATDIGTSALITLQSGHSYRFVLQALGSNLTGQLFDLSNLANPLATASATDSTYALGTAGVITAAGDAMPTSAINVTFDNLLVQTVPEPGSLVLFGIGLVGASFLAFRSRHPALRGNVSTRVEHRRGEPI